MLGQRTTPGAPAFGVDGNAELTALQLAMGLRYPLPSPMLTTLPVRVRSR